VLLLNCFLVRIPGYSKLDLSSTTVGSTHAMFAKMKQLSLTKGELKKITHLRINKKFRNYYCIKVSSTRQGYSIFAKSSTTPVFANLVRNTFADPSSPSIVPSLSKVPSIGELHLYLACPHHLTKSTNIQKHLSLLSSEELQDLDTSHTKDVYRSRLLTRSLARSVLASYLPQPATHPEDLQFSKGQFGKPRLAAPLDGVSFNLSHSPSLICCAVASPALEVGVDVESSRRQFGRNGPLKLARRWLSAEEVERLEGLGLAEQQIQFLQLWTVKEACVKAAGTGISGSPLNSFSLQMLARNPSYLRETAQVSKLHTVPEIVSISLSRQFSST